MSGYVYFTDEQKQRANAVDLEDFLTRRGEKLLRAGREKRMASNHSITVRGNEWYDHAAEKGGLAIDFVQMFYGRNFPDSVTMLLDGEQGQPYRPCEPHMPASPKPFALPVANKDIRRVFAYLTKTRCLDREVVSVFARARLIYADTQHHIPAFVGMYAAGIARQAQGNVYQRGTVQGKCGWL